VQKVREAAARAKCQNNLKQMGIALHSYESASGMFPAACPTDAAPFGTDGTNWGSAWTVRILDHIEQTAIANKWQYSASSGVFNANNVGVVKNVVIPTFRCPSNTGMGDFSTNTTGLMIADYVGIAGADNGFGGISESRICAGNHGNVSGGGILYPFSQTTSGSITDGTSNTMMLAEQAGWMYDSSGNKWDARSSRSYGVYIGTQGSMSGASVSTWNQAGGDNRAYQTVTLRYQIGQTQGWAKSNGNANGVDQYGPANTPISSPHAGGATVARADGTVAFLRDGTALDVLSKFAVKDDGQIFTLD